jgi:hypothetical protein
MKTTQPLHTTPSKAYTAFSAEKRPFEQNTRHAGAYSAQKITASLQQKPPRTALLLKTFGAGNYAGHSSHDRLKSRTADENTSSRLIAPT